MCAQVHWLSEAEKFPVAYYERGGRLHQRMAPGCVARFFNYLRAGRPQQGEQGEVYSLDEAWPDTKTRRLVGLPGGRGGGGACSISRIGAWGPLAAARRA